MASENSYAQLIDDFENGIMVLEDETLSEYIKRMGGVDYNSKADGGLMVAIERFNQGGMAGNKTYHQYHDQYVPMDEESMMYANGGGVGSMMQPKKKSYKDQKLTAAEKKKIKPANQGGGPNYLGKQETVTVPKKWLSDPDHVVAELAYITPREQKILLDENLYGSLKGKPNKGPGGIMSLQGDLGGFSAGPSGGGSPGQGGQGGNDYKSRDYYNMMTGTGTTATSAGGDTVRSKNIAKGAVPEYVTVNPFTSDQRTQYVGSKYKSYGQPNFFANLFSKTPGYRGTYGTGTGFFDRFKKNDGDTITFDEATGQYISSDPRVGDVKPGIGGRVLGGLASLLTGIPFAGSIIGNAIDKYKPKSYFDKMDPAELRRLNSLSITPFNEQKITVPDSVLNRSMVVDSPFSTNITNQKPTANITGVNNNDFEIGNPGKYATADALTEANMADYQTSLVDEFTPGGIDRTNLYEDFNDNRDLISETATSPQFNTSLIDEFGDNRNINMDEFANNNIQMQNYLTDQANYNADPFGNPNRDPRVVSEEYGLVGNNTGEVTASLPGNNIVAGNYSQNAVSGQLYGVPYDDLPVFDQQKLDSLIEQVGTKSTGELARNGGIMGYGRG